MKEMAGYVSGAVLASLFYDHTNSKGDQMGLLLGQVVSHVKDTISDSQIQNSEVETRIYIYASVPFKHDQKFYGQDGRISVAQIKKFLGGRYQDIRGWYSFRRNSSMMISLREKTLHSNLLETLISTHLDNFLFLLCTVWVTEDQSTHSWDHSFYRLGPRGFQTVPVEVTNLGDTTHTEYKQRSSHMVCPQQGVMHSVFRNEDFLRVISRINNIDPDLLARHAMADQGLCCLHFDPTYKQLFLNSAGRVDVEKIQSLTETVHSQLKVLAKAVSDSEHRLTNLQNEVDQYREKMQQKPPTSEEQEKGLSRVQEENEKKLSVDDLLSLDYMDSNPSVEISEVDQHVKEIDKKKIEEHEIILRKFNLSGSKSSQETKTVSLTQPVPFNETRKTCNREEVSEKMEVDVDSTTSQSEGRINSSDWQKDKQRKEKNSDPFFFVSVIIDEQKGVTRSGDDDTEDTKSTALLQKGPEKRMPLWKTDLLSDDTQEPLHGSSVNLVLTGDVIKQSGSLRNAVTSSTTSYVDSKQEIKAERSRSQRLRTNQKMDSSRSRSQEKTDYNKVGLRGTSKNKADSMTENPTNMEKVREYNNTATDGHYRENAKSDKKIELKSHEASNLTEKDIQENGHEMEISSSPVF